MSSSTIDYDALAKQFGAVSSTPPASPGKAAGAIDYDALARQHGAVASTPPERSPVRKTTQAFWEGIGGQALMDLMAGASRTKEGAARTKAAAQGLVEGIRAEPGRVWGELSGAGQAMLKGDLSGTAYRLAGAVPFLGAGAQQVALDFDRGDPAAGVGHTAALVLPFAAGPVARGTVRGAQATGRAAATGATAAGGAVRGVARAIPEIAGGALEGAGLGVLGGEGGALIGAKIGAARVARRVAVRGAREALKARAARAAEALAAETEAAAATAATPPPAPGIIPPERQLGPGPIVTPPPADTSFVRAVPAEYPEVIPPGVLRTNPQAADAAIALREAMGLGPEEFRPPAAAAPDFAAITQAGHVDRVARLMRENGLTASDAMLLDPPDWINLTRSAGIENPQAGGALAKDVVLRLRSLEPPPRKPPATAPVTPPRKPPAAEPAAPEPAAATAAEANAELGRIYPAAEPTPPTPAPTAAARRIEKIAAQLAPDTKLTSAMLDKLPTDTGAQLLVEKLGHGRPAAGEYQAIVDRVRELRGEGPPGAAVEGARPAPRQPTPIVEAKADFEIKKATPTGGSEIHGALDSAAEAAIQRMRDRGTFSGTKLSAGIPVDDLADMAIWGASKLAKGTIDFGKWSKEILAEAGAAAAQLAPHLPKLYAQAQKTLERHIANTADKLPSTQKLMTMYRKGIEGQDWYRHTKSELQSIFGPDTDRFVDFLAATSPNTTVAANTSLALKAYQQWKTGQPFTGYLPETIKSLNKAVAGEEFGGLKVQSFRKNLHGDPIPVTVDRWIARALGFGDQPTVPQYKFMDYLISQVAKTKGLEPRQVQAAIWKTIKDAEGLAGQGGESYEILVRRKLLSDPDLVAAIKQASQ